MLPVIALAAHGSGRPAVSGVDWRPALAREVTKKNPFTGAPLQVTLFEPDLQATLSRAVESVSTLTIAEADAWQRGRELLARRGARLNDGHLAELWMLAMPSRAAIEASMHPAWVSVDHTTYLLPFPADATCWLAALTDDALDREARRLTDLAAWLAEDADSDLPEVAFALLSAVRPLARAAAAIGGIVSAHLLLQ